MTPQTRALIEAAEKFLDARTWENAKLLDAAISSAKAAEGGVETNGDLFCKTPMWVIRRIRELEAQLAKEKAPEGT